MKLILLIILTLTLYATEELYLHLPGSFPSEKVNTSFGKELLTMIKEAEKEISFAIYGLRGQDEILLELINAQRRGVVIRGVVDSDSNDENYYTDTHLLYKNFNIVSDHNRYNMHNKFFIIDSKIVWSGSSNISNTGTGGYNANNAIVIKSKVIANIYLQEFKQMFYGKKFQKQKQKITYENIKTKDSEISIYFSPKSNTYNNGIKKLIKNAQRYVYVPIFYLTHKGLAYELISAKNRGVEVKIILDATAAGNKYSAHRLLQKEGIQVKVENFGGKMHTKSIIVDDEYIVSGSMNFTKAGNVKNDENTIIVKNTNLAREYRDYFLALWLLIPDSFLYKTPYPESIESLNSCLDGIDNDFNKYIDTQDKRCTSI